MTRGRPQRPQHFVGSRTEEPVLVRLWRMYPASGVLLAVGLVLALYGGLMGGVGMLLFLLVLLAGVIAASVAWIDWWLRIWTLWRATAIDADLQLVASGVPHLRWVRPRIGAGTATVTIDGRKASVKKLEESAGVLAQLLRFDLCRIESGGIGPVLTFYRRARVDGDRGPGWKS